MKVPGTGWLKSEGSEREMPMTEGLGIVQFFKLTFKEIGEDHLAAFAGNLTYKALFAIFPFLTLVLSLLGLFNATDLIQTMLDNLSGSIPAAATTFVEDQLLPITKSQASGAFTFGAIISILAALWGVSGAFRSVMDAMNGIYEVEEDRPFWKQYAVSIFLSLAVVVLMLSALGIVVFGSTFGGGLASIVGLGPVFQTVWTIVQWPIVACVVLFTFALIYYFAPAAQQRWRWISLGSVLAFVFWLLFSLAFALYAGSLGSFNETYGSLAGVAILMLYVYYSAFIMLVGAEMNQVIEWHIPGGKSEGEKIPPADERPAARRKPSASNGNQSTGNDEPQSF